MILVPKVTCLNCQTGGHTSRTCRRYSAPLRIINIMQRLKNAGVVKDDATNFRGE